RRDVRLRVRAERALSTSEQRYRLLFEHNLAAVFLILIDGTIQDCNEAFVHLTGLASREEVIGRSTAKHYFQARDREVFVDALRKEGRVIGREVCFRRIDGSLVWGLVNAALLVP